MREWWICPLSEIVLSEPPFEGWEKNGEWAHVIEYAAYAEMKALLEERTVTIDGKTYVLSELKNTN